MQTIKPAQNVPQHGGRTNIVNFSSSGRFAGPVKVACIAAALVVVCVCLCGCHKDNKNEPIVVAPADTNGQTYQQPVALASAGPARVIEPPASGNMDEQLRQLTRELHKTMVGRRLSGDFAEFVAIRNIQVPPPPAGKKYAISKQWKVILVDQK